MPDSELNSLWYERLATAADEFMVNANAAISLYQRAIEKKNPSWLCYQGLGTAYSKQNRTLEAVTQVELALKTAQQEDATPKPETKDIVGLYLLLGQYAYEAGDVNNADKYYSLACEGGDESQVRDGRLGRLKSRLGFTDTEAIQALKSTLAQENGKAEMTAAMEMIALDTDHNNLIARMFAVLKQDPDLLKEILEAMEKAIWNLTPGNTSKVLTGDERFTEDEARSVLLCDRGFAAYLFKVSSDGLKSVNEALRLWEESRDLLANVGGTNALFTRQRATAALASHYFQSIAEGLQLNYYDALSKLKKLASSDSDYNFYRSDAISFLGAAHVLCGDKGSAKEVLVARMKQGLQILSDDILENDKIGFSILQKALEHYQDFKNAVVALSLLGQPDLVTDALYFDVGDITEVDDESKLQALDVVSELAKEVIRVINSQIPETKLQSQRIEAAKAYVDTLVATAEAKTEVNGNSEDEKPKVSDLTAYAHRLLQSRILPLHKAHTPSVNKDELTWSWTCDGRTSDGRVCDKWNSFEDDLYHCIYCSNKDFCGDCFKRLRNPESGVDFMECSAKHRWLQLPHQGNSMYVSMKSKTVRVPIDVRPLDEDDRILKAYYAEDGNGEEITLNEWKERVATEWGISLKTLSETSSEDGKN